MLKHYKINMERSIKIGKKNHVMPNLCYNNVFEVITGMDMERYHVGYGYFNLKADTHVYVRHCFIIDTKTNEVIDPTVKFISHVDKYTDYFTFKEFDNTKDYITNIIENDSMPSLNKTLKQEETQAMLYAVDNGYTLVG